MDGFGLIVTLAVTALATLGGGWWCLHNLKKARYLLDTPTSKIRSAAQGYVELYGVIAPRAESLEGPLSAQPCVWWSFAIDEQVQNERNATRWKNIEKGRSTALLCLSDGTGECWIDPQGAHVLPMTKQVWYGQSRHPLKHQMHRHFLRNFLVGSKRYRYTEQRLHVHEPLYVIGDFVTRGQGREVLDLSATQGAVIREWKDDFSDLVQRFDRDGNGELDLTEWQAVRAAAEQQALLMQQAQQLEPAQHYLRQPLDGRPFVLSNYSEEDIAKRLYGQALLGFIACLGGALAAAHIIKTQF